MSKVTVTIEPIAVSPEGAAAMLGGISLRTLDAIVARGELTPRRITAQRIGYLVRELREYAESRPKATRIPAAQPEQ
jgi:hypothetical protein